MTTNIVLRHSWNTAWLHRGSLYPQHTPYS